MADSKRYTPTDLEQRSPGKSAGPTSLEEYKQALRAQFTVRPMSEYERQIAEDISWAQCDPDVQGKYRGEFIVPRGRTIVAHGHDVAVVLEEASRILGCKKEDLPLVGIVDPLLEIPH
jgi:hypothetical protein